MESYDCLKVSMCNKYQTDCLWKHRTHYGSENGSLSFNKKCKLVNAAVRIFDQIHILQNQIYKSLGGGVIVIGADNKLLYALVIIFGQ